MRKLTAALATFTLVTAALVSGAGPASAKSESWSGVHAAAKVHHVKPASESWSGQHWTARKLHVSPRSESWS
jgi:hypothetical protein